jgi:hypothetical protein
LWPPPRLRNRCSSVVPVGASLPMLATCRPSGDHAGSERKPPCARARAASSRRDERPIRRAHRRCRRGRRRRRTRSSRCDPAWSRPRGKARRAPRRRRRGRSASVTRREAFPGVAAGHACRAGCHANELAGGVRGRQGGSRCGLGFRCVFGRGMGVAGRQVLSENGTRHGDFDIHASVPSLGFPACRRSSPRPAAPFSATRRRSVYTTRAIAAATTLGCRISPRRRSFVVRRSNDRGAAHVDSAFRRGCRRRVHRLRWDISNVFDLCDSHTRKR